MNPPVFGALSASRDDGAGEARREAGRRKQRRKALRGKVLIE